MVILSLQLIQEGQLSVITKTYLYNFDPLKPHFYIVKLGFTGVYIIFLISAQNIDCGYSLEPPRRGGSNEYQQSMFSAEIWKISEFFIWKFSIFGDEISYIFELACFHNVLEKERLDMALIVLTAPFDSNPTNIWQP